MYNKLITIEDIRKQGRPLSMQIDDTDVDSAIHEAQDLDIKPQLGDRLFYDLMKFVEDHAGLPNYSLLLNGGEFENTGNNCGDGFITFAGLRKALIYYTYSRLAKQKPNNLTRFGVMQDQDQYSRQSELKERLQIERENRDIGNSYMMDCFRYMRMDTVNFPDGSCCGRKTKQVPKMRVKIIGD